jgi:quercetin dioxygenase-like cupin family protein
LKADQPGVVAAYHYAKDGELVTVIVWESEDARVANRASDLISEPMAIEARLGMNTVREAYRVHARGLRRGERTVMTDESILRAGGDANVVNLGPNRVRFVLDRPGSDLAFSLTEFLMAPPPAPGPPRHRHMAEEEAIYLVDGRLAITVEDRTTEIAEGGVVYVPRGTTHTLANAGHDPARLFIVFSPAGAEQYWRKAAELIAVSDGSPDPDVMSQLARDHHIQFLQPRRFSDN